MNDRIDIVEELKNTLLLLFKSGANLEGIRFTKDQCVISVDILEKVIIELPKDEPVCLECKGEKVVYIPLKDEFGWNRIPCPTCSNGNAEVNNES